MRRLAAALAVAAALLSGCGAGPDSLRAYLEDTALRREALLRALWFQDNEYARLRLGRFATGRDDAWERLPTWLPPAVPLREGTEEAPRPLAGALTMELPEGAELRAALLRLGEAAFFDYPAQLVGGFEGVAASPELAEAYGLWRGRAPQDPQEAAPRRGGLVRATVPGGTALALSCAACHARAGGGTAEPGRPARIDIGALVQDQAPPGAMLPEGAWGPGRLDVSPDGQDNPAAIPDLRVVALQRHLHHDATLRNDALDPAGEEAPLALALRIETLIITTLGQGARPPPAVALGMALYLRSLAPPAAAASPAPPSPGEALFRARCAGCHSLPGGAGEPVPLEVVGTDPALGLSRERGTGTYRVPTLRRVAERGPLLHDGRVPDLPALLDPARLEPGYAGGLHGAGPVPGHRYGLDLPAAERADLLAFLAAL